MWYHADIRRISTAHWRGYVAELDQLVSSGNRPGVQEEARRIIEETTGDKDFQVVWNEC